MRKISSMLLMIWFLSFCGLNSARGAVPDTGQSYCYDNTTTPIVCPTPGQPYYGQDANYALHPHTYTKLDAGGGALAASASTWAMVRDEVTGLVWENKNGTTDSGAKDYTNPHDADNTYTWYDDNASTNGGNAGKESANDTSDFLAALNGAAFGTYTDWRLPTQRELSELIDADFSSTMLDPAYFPSLKSLEFYWSSTIWINDASQTWVLTYLDGVSGVYYKSYPNCAIAVRGGKPANAFVNNGNGTVSDTASGLMWQRVSVPDKNWKEALSYCESLELGGYTDWRLPDRNELFSLIDYTRKNPSIDITYFPADTPSSLFWTSTTKLPNPAEAFIVWFEYGYTYGVDKDLREHVRAVRTIGALPLTTSTTTSIESSTTTTTVAGGPCPAKKVLGAENPQLEKLRAFRDSSLAKTAVGRKAIEIYYANAGSIDEALERSPALQAFSKKMLEVIAPMLGRK